MPILRACEDAVLDVLEEGAQFALRFRRIGVRARPDADRAVSSSMPVRSG